MRNYFYSIILLTFNACVACNYVAIYSNHACTWALISHHIGKVTFNSNITPYQDRTWHLGGHIGKFSFSGPQKLDIFIQKLALLLIIHTQHKYSIATACINNTIINIVCIKHAYCKLLLLCACCSVFLQVIPCAII